MGTSSFSLDFPGALVRSCSTIHCQLLATFPINKKKKKKKKKKQWTCVLWSAIRFSTSRIMS